MITATPESTMLTLPDAFAVKKTTHLQVVEKPVTRQPIVPFPKETINQIITDAISIKKSIIYEHLPQNSTVLILITLVIKSSNNQNRYRFISTVLSFLCASYIKPKSLSPSINYINDHSLLSNFLNNFKALINSLLSVLTIVLVHLVFQNIK